jgi:hypothetical protein
MRFLACIITVMALLAGCASLEEAYYVDREYGLAQQAAWDNQVAYPDYRYAAKTPVTMDGITAEEIMNVSNETYSEKPEQVEVFQFGLTQ